MNEYFMDTEKWRLPEDVLPDSLAEMAIDGLKGNEGIVLWMGKDNDRVAEVTHLIRLRGPGVLKLPDFINIDSSVWNRVTDVAMEHDVRLIGQIHSHGVGYSLNLSPTDKKYGLQVPGYLSIVAPDYGQRQVAPEDCGVHEYLTGQGYMRLASDEARRRLEVFSGRHLGWFTIGGEE